MHYKSPIPLIAYSGVDKDNLDIPTILKIQKRLLVELDHAGNNQLTIHSVSYTKDDILKLTEEIKSAEVLQFHGWIFESPLLRELLEKGVIFRPGHLISPKVRQDTLFQNFRSFVSPYLVNPVSKGLSQNAESFDFRFARRFLQANELIVDQDFDKTFGKVKPILEEMLAAIKKIASKEESLDTRRFSFIKKQFVDFLNDLPEAFAELRDDFAIAFINLTIAYQHSHFNFCADLYIYLKSLKCSPKIQEVIAKNVASMSKPEHVSEGKSKSSGFGVFFGILTILVAGLRLVSSLNSSGSSYEGLDMEKYVTSMPDVNTYWLQVQLWHVAEKQTNGIGRDSIAEIISGIPTTDTVVHPYAGHYANLDHYMPSKGVHVQIKNKSRYDAVIFVRNLKDGYSALIRRKETLDMTLAYHDRISFYVGNEWVDHFPLNGPRTLTDEHPVHGIFAKVDSATFKNLFQNYQFKYDTAAARGPVTISLKSSRSKEFEFAPDEDVFILRKGQQILYWHGINGED